MALLVSKVGDPWPRRTLNICTGLVFKQSHSSSLSKFSRVKCSRRHSILNLLCYLAGVCNYIEWTCTRIWSLHIKQWVTMYSSLLLFVFVISSFTCFHHAVHDPLGSQTRFHAIKHSWPIWYMKLDKRSHASTSKLPSIARGENAD